MSRVFVLWWDTVRSVGFAQRWVCDLFSAFNSSPRTGRSCQYRTGRSCKYRTGRSTAAVERFRKYAPWYIFPTFFFKNPYYVRIDTAVSEKTGAIKKRSHHRCAKLLLINAVRSLRYFVVTGPASYDTGCLMSAHSRCNVGPDRPRKQANIN